ncbi:MAG: hypothetical protein U0641_05800 [Anaerolineae bacterium]
MPPLKQYQVILSAFDTGKNGKRYSVSLWKDEKEPLVAGYYGTTEEEAVATFEEIIKAGLEAFAKKSRRSSRRAAMA